MSDKQHSDLIRKLDTLIKINASILIDGKEFREQVQLLNNLGLSPREISEATGKTPNNISVTLNKLKLKKSK